MKFNLFNWSILTAFVSYVLFFVIGLMTSNDFYLLILAFVVFFVSVILFSKRAQKVTAFKTGAILGISVITPLLLNGQIILSSFEKFGLYLLFYVVVFLVSGFLAKLIIKK